MGLIAPPFLFLMPRYRTKITQVDNTELDFDQELSLDANNIFFNNASNGFTVTESQAAIEQARLFNMVLSRGGTVGAGTYLQAGGTLLNATGIVMPAYCRLVGLTVSNGANVGSNTVLQLRSRTAVATFVDIAGTTITIPSGSYKASLTGLNVDLGNIEISAYNKSGASLSSPILTLYLRAIL